MVVVDQITLRIHVLAADIDQDVVGEILQRRLVGPVIFYADVDPGCMRAGIIADCIAHMQMGMGDALCVA